MTTDCVFMNKMFAKYVERKMWSMEFDEDLGPIRTVPRPKGPPGRMRSMLSRFSLGAE